MQRLVDEVVVTTLIGIGFGIYVVLARSLLIAFLANWILNWFVFTPDVSFHPPASQWLWPYIIVIGVWLIYRYWWIEE